MVRLKILQKAPHRNSLVSPLFVFGHIILLCCVALGAGRSWAADDVSDLDILEFQIKNDQLDNAWTYLRDRYGGKDFFLKKVDPSLRSEFFSELWYEGYFDTSNLALLGGDNAIRYSIWVGNNGTKPGIKNEVAEILIHNIQGYGLDLAGISNFGIISGDSIQFEVAHYNVTTSPDEKHSLLGVIKRAVRPVFKDVVKKIGIENPFRLINVINVESRRAGFEIIHEDIPIGRIYLEEVNAERFGIESLSCVLKFIPDAGLGSTVAPLEMTRIEKAIQNDLSKNISLVRQIKESDYQLAYGKLEEKFPFLRLLLEYPIIKRFGEAILLSLCGLLVLSLFFHRRLLKRG